MLGDHREALALLEDSLERNRAVGDTANGAYATYMIGHVMRGLGHPEQAETLLWQALETMNSGNQRDSATLCVETLAGVALDRRKAENAARLFGLAERMRNETGAPIPGTRVDEVQREIASAKSILGDQRYATLRAEGYDFDLTSVLEERRRVLPGSQ
jgi:hypothetical protein